MLTTGLLSLNVHEALTFDGAELCLHPDLFVAAPGSANNSLQTRTNQSSQNASDDGKQAGSSVGSGNNQGTAPLAVGDMIEIRVWDSKPLEATKSPVVASASLRKSAASSSSTAQSPPSTIVQSILPPEAPSLPAESSSTTITAGAPSVTPKPGKLSREDSLQYSESEHPDNIRDRDDGVSIAGSSVDKVSEKSGEAEQDLPSALIGGDAPSTPPTKSVTTSNPALPPVFPRGRANTQDIPSKVPTKPTAVHRRVSSNATGVPPPQKSPQHIRHSREISDMTIDTHQLDAGDIPHPESHDHDDDDVWSKVSITHKMRLSFVLLVTEKTLTSLKGNTRTQISMLRQVADLYNLSSYDMVTIHKIDPQDEQETLEAVSADFLVVTIKDQFISRGDMLIFQKSLEGTWVYEGQRLNETTRGIKAHAREIRHGNFSAKSGIVTDKTMITFRSRSARIVWLVQLSAEMWDYRSPYENSNQTEAVCEIYFDQWIRFLYKLFAKWKALEVTHSLTVVFFSRTFVEKSSLDCKDFHGRPFEDHYKTIIENKTCTDWESLLVTIKDEFVKYPIELGWNLTNRRPSNAIQGNVLEAINVTMNLMQFHFLDRDLHRTGNSIVVVSPGCGVFEVDPNLSGITYQRMMDHGIGSDMLSLGLPPLHIAPFFLYNHENKSADNNGTDTRYYEVPHWMHLSFVSYDSDDYSKVKSEKKNDAGITNLSQLWLETFEVTGNGLLRRRKDQQYSHHGTNSPSSHVRSPSTFSALGNVAATPRPTQERQLISGRNFRDILEACRPRLAGISMPSPLVSILKLHELLKNKQDGHVEDIDDPLEAKEDEQTHMPLREWGAIDFDSATKSVLRHREYPGIRRKLSVSERSDGSQSESGSASSGFVSHVSSMYGMSYDRVLWGQMDSPASSKIALQMQRSPSLEFDVKDVNQSRIFDHSNEDSISINTDPDYKLGGSIKSASEPFEEWQATEEGAETKASRLRRIMEARDAQLFSPEPTRRDSTTDLSHQQETSMSIEDIELGTTPKTGMLSSHQRRVQENNSGGLGAALSQYSSSGDISAMPAPRIPRLASANRLSSNSNLSQFQLDRARAASPMFPMLSNPQFEGGLGRSPMLFQPMNSGFGNPSEHPELSRRDSLQGLGQRRFVVESKEGATRDGQSPTTLGTLSPQDTTHMFQPLSSSVQGAGEFTRTLSKTSFSRSPPNAAGIVSRAKPKPVASSPGKGHARDRNSSGGNKAVGSRRKMKAAFNPFRQSDEDEVLAQRSHNRRRWSHVFPVGEVEFKRHSGPIWNSLTSPAILPISVDYFPSPQELRDESAFQFNPYTVTLGGLDKKQYSSHADLLMEMVRQRLTQDFQIVTDTAVEESESRVESQRQVYTGRTSMKPHLKRGTGVGRGSYVPSLPTINYENSGTIKHYLSMGHRIQVLTYDPSSDTIEIVHYNRRGAQNDPMNVIDYRFLLYSNATEKYSKSIQTFKKYADPYKWNKVDNIICGEEDRTMEEGMRSRRLMFALIPPNFTDTNPETEYISKFQRLVEYLSKLREKEESQTDLKVEIISRGNKTTNATEDSNRLPRGTTDTMIRFLVQLRKGKRDPFEWTEVAIDSVFDTARSYRISFNWLVASSAKVEAQVQLLHRRCTQYGMQLTPFPQSTISRNLFLNPFVAPPIVCIRDKKIASVIDQRLLSNSFVDDGIFYTEPHILACIDDVEDFDFPKYRNGKVRHISGKQYVHRSGAFFVRKMRDRQGWAILVGIENSRTASRDGFKESVRSILCNVEELATIPLQENEESMIQE